MAIGETFGYIKEGETVLEEEVLPVTTRMRGVWRLLASARANLFRMEYSAPLL
jgi:hypothetical protein